MWQTAGHTRKKQECLGTLCRALLCICVFVWYNRDKLNNFRNLGVEMESLSILIPQTAQPTNVAEWFGKSLLVYAKRDLWSFRFLTLKRERALFVCRTFMPSFRRSDMPWLVCWTKNDFLIVSSNEQNSPGMSLIVFSFYARLLWLLLLWILLERDCNDSAHLSVSLKTFGQNEMFVTNCVCARIVCYLASDISTDKKNVFTLVPQPPPSFRPKIMVICISRFRTKNYSEEIWNVEITWTKPNIINCLLLKSSPM